MPQHIAKNINEQRNQIIPEAIEERRPHRELNEAVFDFMNLYNIKQITNSTTTTDTELQNQITIETLRILTNNVGGSLKHELETNSNLLIETSL